GYIIVRRPKAGAKAPAAKNLPKQPETKQVEKGPPPRTPYTADEAAAAVIPGIADARVWGDSDTEFDHVLPHVNGPWLELSGGGADGADGAGLIAGWSDSGNRPEFALVSGVSIGALIAPYAFLGPSRDAQLRESFLSINAGDVFEDHATPD